MKIKWKKDRSLFAEANDKVPRVINSLTKHAIDCTVDTIPCIIAAVLFFGKEDGTQI